MPAVNVEIDVSDVLGDLTDDELRRELQERERRNGQEIGSLDPDPWWSLQHDLDFQMALNRSDAGEVMRRVQDALCSSHRRAA